MCFLGDRLGKSLGEVGRMSLDELAIWDAYYSDFGPDEHRDRLFGMLAAVTANCHSSRGGFTAEDFVPWTKRAQTATSEDEVKARLRAWATASQLRMKA